MSCAKYEELVALYAGGDLTDAAVVEKHLAGCVDCRVLLDELRETRIVLAGLGEVELDGARIRRAVLRELEGRPAQAKGLLYMAFAIAAAVVVCLAVWWMMPGWVDAPRISVAVARPVLPTIPEPVRVVKHRPLAYARGSVARAEPRPLGSSQQATETLVVKLVTDDPDVVIYWLVDNKGDGE